MFQSQEAQRNAEQWNVYMAGVHQQFTPTPEQEAEIYSGMIDERVHAWAKEEKDRLIKDRGFYRRLMEHDRAAKKDWGLVNQILSCRPVRRA
jgi:hypothetical protein